MKKTITILAAAVLATAALTGCGTGKAREAVANAPQPTVTVNTDTTPAICTTALNDADSAIQTAGEGFGILSDSLTAASKLDVAGIEAANIRMEALNKRLEVALSTYKTSRDACKAGN